MKNGKDGQKPSTRDTILRAIQTSTGTTVESLAQVAGVSPVTVRHHLNSLQGDGLIESSSVRRKVGRPYYVYTLTEKGQELFPKRYVRLTARLLDELTEVMTPDALDELFHSVGQRVIGDRSGEYEHLSLEERLDYLVALLEDEGFLATWEKTEGGYQVIEHNCPYVGVGGSHTEVCTFDKELMLSVLQTDLEQHSCILEGADCCQFTLVEEPAPTTA